MKTIKLNKKNSFVVELSVIEGFYTLSDNNEETQLYLKPGFDLNIFINTKAFDESIIFKGKGAAENNYLVQSYLLNEGFGNLKYYGYYANLNEAKLLHLLDSIKQLEFKLLNANKDQMLESFYNIQTMKIDYDYRLKLYNYESMHKMLTKNQNFKVSSSFPDPFLCIDLNKSDWIDYYEYTNLLDAYIWSLAMKDLREKRDSNNYLSYLKNMETKIGSDVLKEKFAYNIGKYRLGYIKDLDMTFDKLISFIRNSEKAEEIRENYRKVKLIQKGSPSPDFSFKDINGNVVKLSDFKGKYVYIDIWATWCGPCLSEIPDLKRLTDTLSNKNIVFVSICKSDLRDSWEKMVKSKQLKGVQLFAENDEDSFFKDYLVSGIPHFILLDHLGNIIDANAMRPSEPLLLQTLLKLLN
jgi:thiol-disulfide isomerase/thioredoxin